MGGDYYDRDVGTTNNSSANQALTQSSIHSSCNPTRWKDEKLECIAKNPIVFGLDVTGSMGEWTKIIYDKMPMFYGQIMMQKYLDDPCISFCAIGDHSGDQAPLQVTEFGRGNEIDQLISKIYLEGNGQGNQKEGYEMCPYFYTHRAELVGNEIPFLFITGDEGFYDSVPDNVITRLLGVISTEKSIKGEHILQEAMKKYNLFHIKKDYSDSSAEKTIRKQWEHSIGKERVLDLKTPKACIDIILGAIALTSGKRSLDQYIDDLKQRGQDSSRINEVMNALNDYWISLKSNKVHPIINKHKEIDMNEISTKSLEELKTKFGDIFMERIQIQEKLKDQIPSEYICPITKRILIQPVTTSDGMTFEKIAIELYLNLGLAVNPITKEKIDVSLLKNTVLTKMVDSFVAENSS